MRREPSSVRRLVVAPHVRICAVDGQLILLDLRESRYAGLGGPELGRLARIVDRWPLREPAGASREPCPRTQAMAEPLLARGWLVDDFDPSRTDDLPDIRLPEAERTLQEDVDAGPMSAGTARILRTLGSATSASWNLRRNSLQTIARKVTRRRATLSEKGVGSEDRLVSVVSTYLRLRPLLFSAHDRCLHDSLALVTLLAAERIAAHWVIGVRIRPFAAHSWVQLGDLVLNDQHEQVRAYRPILVV